MNSFPVKKKEKITLKCQIKGTCFTTGFGCFIYVLTI